MSARRNSLHRLAVHVLLVWLLALTVGFVHACVVNAQTRSAAHATAQLDADAVHLVHDHRAGAGDHASHDGSVPCERCCEDASALAPAAVKLQADGSGGLWLASPAAPSFLLSFVLDADGVPHSRPERWRAAVPIPIAFLRLAL
ncbi:MAG: hypothetical protein NDJ19_06830 [Ramlibacter sp.]|nr:hypothetical protein [Ramlibacter sp.]